MPLPEAVSQIHYPENEQALQAARLRLGFDELFLIQLGMQERRSRWQREAPEGHAFQIDLPRLFVESDQLPPIVSESATSADESAAELGGTLWSSFATAQPFEATLPFHFTGAQK